MGCAPSEVSYKSEPIRVPTKVSSPNKQSNKIEIKNEDIININKNVSKVQEMITESIGKIRGKNDVKIIFLIGTTGSGKSSLTHLLKGGKATIIKYNGNYVLECSDKVFHGMKSGTVLPQIEIDDKNDIIYCDCPGFLDTNGFIKEIENSFTFDKLLERIPDLKIKILIVESISTFDFARGELIRKELKRIQKMFLAENNSKFFEKIGLVVTKYIKGSNIDINEKINSTLNIPINENHIFIFPAPTSTSGEYKDFDQKDKLLSFINEEKTFIENPKHQVSLDEGTYQFVQKAKFVQMTLFQNNINEFFSSVEYENSNLNPDKIGSCIRTLNNIDSQLNQQFNDALTFVQIIRQNGIAHYNRQILKDIEESQIFTDFIAKILKININKEIKKSIIKEIEKTINHLEHEKNQKEAIEREKQNTRNIIMASTVNQCVAAAAPFALAGIGYAASKIPRVSESTIGSQFIQSCFEPLRAQAYQNTYNSYSNTYNSYQNSNQYTFNSYQMMMDRINDQSGTYTPHSLI